MVCRHGAFDIVSTVGDEGVFYWPSLLDQSVNRTWMAIMRDTGLIANIWIELSSRFTKGRAIASTGFSVDATLMLANPRRLPPILTQIIML